MPALSMRWIVALTLAWIIVALIVAMSLATHVGPGAGPQYVGG